MSAPAQAAGSAASTVDGPLGAAAHAGGPHDLDAWERLDIRHQPPWDPAELAGVTARLARVPPLVFAGEVDTLRSRLAEAAAGRAFVLQAGDCAETFAGATADGIRARLRTILQMAVVLTYAASTPVVKIGRLAGQFAKPRSSATETREGTTLPAYLGDAVNDFAFTADARRVDAERLMTAYHTSAATLNLVRAFTTGGDADLRAVHTWNTGFAATSGSQRYEAMAREITRAIDFMAAAGADFEAVRTVEMYSSHEALLLPYERALTRTDSRTGLPYDTSAHMLWVGERTRGLGEAHVDLLSRVRNPLGVKLGPTTTVEQALGYVQRLDPDREPGRLTFITRMGASAIRERLPDLVAGVSAAAPHVTWVCDPMHGNTITSASGYKTRRFDDVIDEVRGFFEVHRSLGTVPGGLHAELTGDDVTEILGGHGKILDADLGTRYESLCDPRLNHQQSLETAFLVAEMLQARR